MTEINRNLDKDLLSMSKEDLITEVTKLRNGIRQHRDSSEHDLCWYHPDLWGLLSEKTDPLPTIPEWPQFRRGCIAYYLSLGKQIPGAPRTEKPYTENPQIEL